MPRNQHNATAYPNPSSVEILGGSGSIWYNQAIDCWAVVLERATADNEQTFNREEWLYLADVNYGTLHEPSIWNAGEILAASVEDGNTLDGLGAKWFEHQPTFKVARLAEKLRGLHYIHAWAVIWCVKWFWKHCQEVDRDQDPWWTLAYRKEFFRSQSRGSSAALLGADNTETD